MFHGHCPPNARIQGAFYCLGVYSESPIVGNLHDVNLDLLYKKAEVMSTKIIFPFELLAENFYIFNDKNLNKA